MGKMIAVCGAPGSGKTTAALKIAEEIFLEGVMVTGFLAERCQHGRQSFLFMICGLFIHRR